MPDDFVFAVKVPFHAMKLAEKLRLR